MNETLTDRNLSTAEIANSQRTREVDATQGNMPDLSPRDTVYNAGAMTPAQPVQAVPNVNVETAQQGANAQQAPGPLFADEELRNLRSRWDQAQGAFVDEPRRAVEQADSLVADVVHRIAEQFANERASLEQQWDRGDNVSTEDLRQALKRYRSFFDRLLSF